MNEIINVKMKLRAGSIARLNKIKQYLATTKTDTIRLAIDILKVVIDSIRAGKKVYIEDENGQRNSLVIPELKNKEINNEIN